MFFSCDHLNVIGEKNGISKKTYEGGETAPDDCTDFTCLFDKIINTVWTSVLPQDQ